MLLKRLDESRAVFQTFCDAADRDPEAALADAAALERIHGLQRGCHRLGWCLGVIAAARGSNLLRARRERNGLPALVELVEAALGRTFTPSVDELPALAPGAGDGWEAAFVIAYLFFCAGRGEGRTPCRWTLAHDGEDWQLELDGPGPPRPELAHELFALAPTLRLDAAPDGTARARFPLDWLEPRP